MSSITVGVRHDPHTGVWHVSADGGDAEVLWQRSATFRSALCEQLGNEALALESAASLRGWLRARGYAVRRPE